MPNGIRATGRALVCTLGVAVALGGVASPASAQYYRDGYDSPRRYDDGYGRRYRDDDYSYSRRRRYDDDDDGPRFRGPPPPPPRYGGRGGSICVTARGNCPTGFAPINSPCACDVPGFGIKRGAVGR